MNSPEDELKELQASHTSLFYAGLTGVIIIIAASIIFAGISLQKGIQSSTIQPDTTPPPHTCSPGSKICADGSVVKRTGPNCSFPPCPTGTMKVNPTGNPALTPFTPESTITRPTPTTAVPRIQTKQDGDATIYQNNVLGFSFRFPNDLVINSNSTENSISFLQKQGDLMAQRLHVDVESTTQNPDDYAGAKGYYSYGDKESTTVNGRAAIFFTKNQSSDDLCHDGDKTNVKRIKLALIQGSGYMVTFLPNDSCWSYKTDWFGPIPSSLQVFK